MTTMLADSTASALSVVRDDHEQIDAALEAVTAALGGPSRELLLAYDRVVGLLSRHLLAMEVAVCPVVAEQHSAGARPVRDHLSGARRLEQTLREVGQVIWGDALAPHVPLAVLHRELLEQMARHRAEEERMLAALEAAPPPAQCASLGRRLQRATLHAPTRPHPRAVRRLLWTRALYRPVAVFDKVLDTLNARRVPPPRYAVSRRRPVGLWASYALGRPLPRQDDSGTGTADHR